jgi:hypothetical protein
MMPMVRLLAPLLALLLTGAAAAAADLAYPPGSRVGLVPLETLAPATTFAGFESRDDKVKVLIAELPAAAYAEVEATLKVKPAGNGPVQPEAIETKAGKAFFTVESATVGADSVKRYSMILPGSGFSGYVAVQVADGAGDSFRDDAIKAMLASTSVRGEVPPAEVIAAMPFKVDDLAGFKTVRMLAPGAAVLLADAPADASFETTPYMIIGAMGGVPDKTEDRARFAQQVAAEIPGLRDAKLTMAEPVRIAGSPGFETRVDAVTGKENTPVTVVQWLRFGSGKAALRVIGSAPRDGWASAFTRFRSVRDGIDPK